MQAFYEDGRQDFRKTAVRKQGKRAASLWLILSSSTNARRAGLICLFVSTQLRVIFVELYLLRVHPGGFILFLQAHTTSG